MLRAIATLMCLLSSIQLSSSGDRPTSLPSFDYKVAYAHELKPHRRTIPVEGVRPGYHQLGLTLTVSPAGEVVKADLRSDPESAKFWPRFQGEVTQWKFTPFEADGKAVMAQVDEYVDIVPAEQFPTVHVAPPVLRPNSKVTITLQRTVCFGSCPAYIVTVSTSGIVFDGGRYVSALGKHTDTVDPDEVRKLAQRFLAADFYSMDAEYRESATDNPTYILSISIDGHTKKVVDYIGVSVGMPAVITDLEDAVDTLARTDRWIH